MGIRDVRVRAVTFDCWDTLVYEADRSVAHELRLEALLRAANRAGPGADRPRAAAALEAAWVRHIGLWRRGIVTGAGEIADWVLADLGAWDAAAVGELAGRFAEAALEAEILPLEGARETLEGLARAGVRRALVCDTGLSPGPVVRRLLERAELLHWLEVQIFSDEQGVPKPHRRMFEAALGPLAIEPAAAIHVGDLRRTDVAGGRNAGMRTIRIRHRNDDASELPEADAVADSHAHLRELLDL
jgi:FMN phosphatase YigB (HAD superfamily)